MGCEVRNVHVGVITRETLERLLTVHIYYCLNLSKTSVGIYQFLGDCELQALHDEGTYVGYVDDIYRSGISHITAETNHPARNIMILVSNQKPFPRHLGTRVCRVHDA